MVAYTSRSWPWPSLAGLSKSWFDLESRSRCGQPFFLRRLKLLCNNCNALRDNSANALINSGQKLL
jgi:hypothetical protein